MMTVRSDHRAPRVAASVHGTFSGMGRACGTMEHLPALEEMVRLAADRIDEALRRESLMADASDGKDRCGGAR